MDNKELFLNTRPSRLFLRAAIPGSISMLASTIYGLFDGMLVGQLLGKNAFAGVNLSYPLVVINFALADLIGVGSAVPISICLGQKRDRDADNYFSCACLMIVLAGAFMGVLLYFMAPGIMTLMGADEELASYAVSYVRIYALFSPLTTITFALDNFLRICGKIRMSMFLNILMSVMSVVLEFIFLYFLRTGVWAAAFTTCLSMLFCAAIALYPFVRGRFQLHFVRPVFSVRLLRQIVSAGSPAFLSNIAGRITSIIMNMVLLKMGGADAVTVYGIQMYVAESVQPLLYGTCDSLQPAIGYNYGARRIDRVKALEKCCMIASALICGISVALMLVIPETISGLFMQAEETALLPVAVRAIKLLSITFVTRWFWFAIQSLFVALDKPLPATALSLSNALIFPLLLIAALWPLQLDGLWLNMSVTSALDAVLAAIQLVRMRKTLFAPHKD